MSATTPGMRRIWMEAVVQCVNQTVARISLDSGLTDPTSFVADTASVKSDSARQNSASVTSDALASLQIDHKTVPVSHSDAAANSYSQTVSDKAEPESASVQQLPSSDTLSLIHI